MTITNNRPVLLLLSIVVYYSFGYALAIVAMLCNSLVWGHWNIFGYIMPWYPFISGFLIGMLWGRKNNVRGSIVIATGILVAIAFLEMKLFHSAFLTAVMHPVPQFKIRFPMGVFILSLIVASMAGYHTGCRGRIR